MKVIFIFAHPDDETFSSGGTIAKLAQKGVTIKLITATKGEEGQLGNPPIATKDNIAEIREKELKNAAKILGISKIYFLGFKDGSLPMISIKKLSRKVLEILTVEKPDIVVTFGKEGASRHPDHIRIGKVGTYVFKKYMDSVNKKVKLYHVVSPRSLVKKLKNIGIAYNAFGEIKGTRDSQITTTINISETIDKKIKALNSHKTQRKDVERFLKRSDFNEYRFEFFQLVTENAII